MKLKLATAALAIAGALAGSASAATVITFSPYQFTLNPGETLVSNFDAPTAPGYILGGTASILTGNTPLGAAPATSATTADTTSFLSVQGAQFETISTPLIREISFYIGSVDTYNTITFTHSGGGTEAFTGTDLTTATAAFDLANGNQTASSSNGRYTFNFTAPVTGVRLDSSQNSFEISNIGAVAVPEPATWGLMIVGFGGIGAVLRRRQSMGSVATA